MVARCPRLKAFITTNDKTPFTDGHIDVYSGLGQSKENWTGRVTVQVKGRTRATSSGQLRKYPVARTDLQAFQKDSGVLYFVVTVDPSTSHATPYFALLSPFAIASLLKSSSRNERQTSIKLKEFPKDPESIERIVALALKTREQNVATGFDSVLFDHIESFTLHTAFELNLDAPLTLAYGDSDFALELNTTGGLSVPLDGEFQIFPADYVTRSVDVTISSGTITYDRAAIKRIDENTAEARLSDGLQLLFSSTAGTHSTTVNVSPERTLAGRLKALEFFLALLDTRTITVNGTASPFQPASRTSNRKLLEHLATLRALAELLLSLGADIGLIDLDQLDEQQVRQLNVLYRGFVLGEEITDASAKIARVVQRVGQWHVTYLITSGSAPDKWQLVDPFSIESRRQFRRGDKGNLADSVPVTAYDIVEDEHLPTMINMRLDSIVGAYETIADFASTFEEANHRVLALITAADRSELRMPVLLKAAEDLNEWLIAEQGDQPHHLINRWQIMWRRGNLEAEQRGEVRMLKRELLRSADSRSDLALVACALLLGDEEEVDDLLLQLPQDGRDQLKKWPIWRIRQPPPAPGIDA